MSSRAGATWIALDPHGYAERVAIVEASERDAAERERSEPRTPAPGPRLDELLHAELRKARQEDPEAHPDWPTWQRVIGYCEAGARPLISEDRKKCNPPLESFRFSESLVSVVDDRGNRLQALQHHGHGFRGRFLGLGRGGKWWAGARAAAYPMDAKGEAAGELERSLGLGRRDAERAGRGLLKQGSSSRAPQAGLLEQGGPDGVTLTHGDFAADADGRAVGAPDRGTWEPGEAGPKPKRRSRSWWKGRREAQRLHRGLLRIQADRQANCRRYPLGGAVGLRQHRETDADGATVSRLSWHGTETCASVWSCPECSRLIRTRRAGELGQLERWAGSRAYLLTLTIAHESAHDLRSMRRGMSNAWRAVTRGAPWERFRRKCQIAGYVRALEVTSGPNGWHPHLHVIVIGGPGWPSQRVGNGQTVIQWLAERWRGAVVEQIGPEHCPSLEHGCDLRPLGGSGYLVKMGLELSLDWTKRGRGLLHRNPWQIAVDWCEEHDPSDRELWQEYARGMKGAQQLTWSLGLRKLAGIAPALDDATIASDDSGREVGAVSRIDWEWLSKGVGEQGYPWTAHALEIGEAAGLAAMRDWIERKRAALHVPGFALKLGDRKGGQDETKNGTRHRRRT